MMVLGSEIPVAWWRHWMEAFSALLVLFGYHRSPTYSPHKGQWRGADIFFDLNKRLSKQSRRRWFETPSRSLWRHCNGKWSTQRNKSVIGRNITANLYGSLWSVFCYSLYKSQMYIPAECISYLLADVFKILLKSDAYQRVIRKYILLF